MKNIKGFDLNLFKVLSAIYRQRNLTKAGDSIGMSQPAVSRSLERLNHLFGERLFIRIEGEMRPTRTTEMVIPMIEDALALLETSINSVSDFDPNGFQATLKFGLNDYCLAVLFPELTRLLKQNAPSISFSVLATTYLDAPLMLRRGDIDCAVVSGLIEGHSLDSEALFEEDYSVVASSAFFKDVHRLDLAAYLEYEHVLVSYLGHLSGWVDEELGKMGHKRKISMSVHSFAAVPQVVLNYPYLCAIPTRLAKHLAIHYDIKIYALPIKSKTHTFYFVRSTHVSKNAISNWIRGQFVAACKNLT